MWLQPLVSSDGVFNSSMHFFTVCSATAFWCGCNSISFITKFRNPSSIKFLLASIYRMISQGKISWFVFKWWNWNDCREDTKFMHFEHIQTHPAKYVPRSLFYRHIQRRKQNLRVVSLLVDLEGRNYFWYFIFCHFVKAIEFSFDRRNKKHTSKTQLLNALLNQFLHFIVVFVLIFGYDATTCIRIDLFPEHHHLNDDHGCNEYP